jgi:hypothetical protein
MGKQSPNKLTKQEEEDTADQVSYTIFGRHDLLDGKGNPLTEEEKLTYAKQVLVGKRRQYFVMTGEGGKLYNPLGLFSAYERKYNSTTGRFTFKLIKCSKVVFDNYVAFLRTQNVAWLKHAEREI